MIHTITLRSTAGYAGRFPTAPVGHLLNAIPGIVRESVSMAFRRRSNTRGRPPKWLVSASDVRLVDVSGQDEPRICFDVPTLGDAAGELYDQAELFASRPDADDTGFDLLGDVFADVADSNEESDRFDPSLLKSLTGLSHVVNGAYQELLLCGRRYIPDAPAILDNRVIETARSLYSKTPEPVRARVAGVLDTVRVSAQTFGLKLTDGQEIKGVFGADDYGTVLALLASQKPAVVRGDAVFRPSGQLLLIDADGISEATDEAKLWSRMPQPREVALDVAGLRRRQGPRSGLAAVVGRWPGDETDEEIQAAMEAIL